MQNLATQNWVVPAIVIAVAIIALAIAWAYSQRRRSLRLRSHFGPEYERAVSDFGSRQKAENDLARRGKQLNQLQIRSLSAAERQHFATEWSTVQSSFVDDPSTAVLKADRLVTEVLRVRGYPTEDIEERFDDVSAAYPRLAGNYREACAIVSRNVRGNLNTEDRRRAMVLYRDLFDELFREETSHEEFRRVS
jgi:hypothetical protein